jgi:hypothetical protein
VIGQEPNHVRVDLGRSGIHHRAQVAIDRIRSQPK